MSPQLQPQFAGSAPIDGESRPPQARLLLRRLAQWPLDRYYVYAPPQLRAHAAPLVSVHGISRNARDHALLLAPLARQLRSLLIAPLFPAAHWHGYQRLCPGAHGGSPLDFLDAVVANASSLFGISAPRSRLLGFSGGAQFAHRYALLRAQRIHSLALSAAGWYTLPDLSQPWPLGVATRTAPSTAGADLPRWLSLPMLVSVGSLDGDDRNVRHTACLDAAQGRTRAQRAARFVSAVRAAATARELRPRIELRVVDGARHDFGDVLQRGLRAELLNWYLTMDEAT
jgi:pimeloyl-ACP methyl ester carboxylesterase